MANGRARQSASPESLAFLGPQHIDDLTEAIQVQTRAARELAEAIQAQTRQTALIASLGSQQLVAVKALEASIKALDTTVVRLADLLSSSVVPATRGALADADTTPGGRAKTPAAGTAIDRRKAK